MSRVFALQPSPTEPATPPYQAPGGGVAGVRPAAGEAFASKALHHDVSSSQL